MNNWQKVNLDKLCFFEKGKIGLAKAIPGDYPLVTTSAERKTNDSYQFDTKAVCIPLVSSTGHGHASLNYVHYQEGKFALGTILVALIPKDEAILNAQFLHLYLSRLKDMILVPLMSGAANVSLSISKIKTIEIPLPSIDEQLKIVELFRNLVNENNELIEEINTQQSLLKQLKQTILQEAIEGKFTANWRAKNPDIATAKELLEQIKTEKEKLVKDKKIKLAKPLAPINEDENPFDIPQSWEWCRLDDFVSLHNGSVRRGPFGSAITKDMFVPKGENTYKVYEQKNAIQKDSKLGEYYITEKHYKALKSFTVEAGDIIISCAGTIGETYILPDELEKGIINQALLKININNKILLNQYFIHLFSSLTKKQVNDEAIGSAMKNMVSLKYLKSNVGFPIPPIEEQKEIVSTIENFFAITDELEGEINQNKTTVDNLMATVLKEAFED